MLKGLNYWILYYISITWYLYVITYNPQGSHGENDSQMLGERNDTGVKMAHEMSGAWKKVVMEELNETMT